VLHGTRALAQRIRLPLPGALLAILIPALLVLAMGWHAQGVRTVSDLSPLDEAGLRFHLPSVPLGDLPALLFGALALSIFSLMEATNVAKAVSMQAGERISASREFFGQGLASLVGGFFQCMPSSGSPARTSVNFSSGARTRLAAAFSGLFVWLALLLFAGPIGYIPIPSLAGVLIISALGIINRHQITTTWKSGGVAQLVMVATYLAAVFLPLQYAIYVGVLLSSLIYLYQSSQMHMHFLTRDAQGRFLEHSIKDITCIYPRVVLLNIEGPLFFGATEDLERQLMRIFSQGIRVIVLRMRRVQMLGSTGIIMLENLVRQARRLGIHIYLSEVNEETMLALHGSGLEQIVGPERIFAESPALFDATEQALQAARPLAGEDEAAG
jgi:sulfate permease, SulP family